MKINVYNEYKFDIDVKAGDIIAYYNPEHDDYDYFMIIETQGLIQPFRLLNIEDSTAAFNVSFDTLQDLVEYAKKPVNGYQIYEVIPSDELELRRL